MSHITRILNVFIAPGEAFTSLKQDLSLSAILTPLIILSFVGIFSAGILQDLMRDMQYDQSLQRIEQNEQIPPEEKESMQQQVEDRIYNPTGGIQALSLVSSALATPIRVLFMALIVMLIGNFIFGGKAAYSSILAMTGYAYLITILELLVKIPLMLNQWTMEVFTGLGLLGLGEPGDFIYAWTNGIDLFALWRIVLLGIGMGVFYERGTRPFILALVVYWILQVTVLSGLHAAML